MDKVVVADDKCFTVRYTTKPESIGSVPYKLEHDAGGYIMRSDQTELRGSSVPGKDVEAVLVWDNATNSYVLRLVSDNVRVSKVQKQRQQSTNPVFRNRVATPQVMYTPPPPVSEAADSEEDDFGDLATELAGELRKADSEEEESEEE